MMNKYIKIKPKIIFATAIVATLSFTLLNIKKITAYAYHPLSAPIQIDEQYAANVVKEKLSLSGDVHTQKIKGGNSGAKLFTITSGHKKYVLRYLGHKSETEIRNEIETATIASKMDYSPHIYFADEKQAIIIMDFLPNTKTTFKERELLYPELACLLQKIHSGPQFSNSLDVFDEIEMKLKHINPTNNNIIPLDNIEKTITTIHQALVPHRTTKPCHNDLTPNNMVFLGPDYHNNFKAIDCEYAAQGDPYFDVATVAVCFCHNHGSDTILLKEYLKRQPSAIETAKLYLMKQIVWIVYGLGCLKRAQKVSHLYQSLKILSDRDFINSRFDNSTDFENEEYQLTIAKFMITQFLKNTKSQEFQEAISLLKISFSSPLET